MREIKFKLWHKFRKKMIPFGFEDIRSYYVDCSWESNNIKGICLTAYCGDNPDVIIMQYTGLKDKNGKEVYDKDIYKNHDNGCIGILTYDEYGLWTSEYKNGELYNNRPFRELDTTNFEIIGNKYENPKLLK